MKTSTDQSLLMTEQKDWGEFKAAKLHWLVLVSFLSRNGTVDVLIYVTCELV